MMKYKGSVLLLIGVFLGTVTWAQNMDVSFKPPFSAADLTLKGPVKVLAETSQESDNPTLSEDTATLFSRRADIYSFLENGQLSSYARWSKIRGFNNTVKMKQKRAQYNYERGKLSSRINNSWTDILRYDKTGKTVIASNKEDEEFSTDLFTSNNKNDLYCWDSAQHELGTWYYLYSNGDVKHETSIQKSTGDGYSYSKSRYNYSAANQLAEVKISMGSLSSATGKAVTATDITMDRGIIYNKPSAESEYRISYKENGQIDKVVCYEDNDKMYTATYSYDFDEYGNWTRCTIQYDFSRKAKQEMKKDDYFDKEYMHYVRTIKYYTETARENIDAPYEILKNESFTDPTKKESSQSIVKVKKDSKFGFINKDGNMVIPIQYQYIEAFNANGLAVAKYNGKYGVINHRGEVVIPFRYNDVQPVYGNDIFKLDDYPGGKWGLYAVSSSKNICATIYDEISDISREFFAVVTTGEGKAKKYGILDSKGNELMKTEYDKILTYDGIGVLAMGGWIKYGDNIIAIIGKGDRFFKLRSTGKTEQITDDKFIETLKNW